MSAPMVIAIVGGHGQIARHLTLELVRRGHEVRGLVRSLDQFDDLRADGAEPILCDLEAATDPEMDNALSDSDIVVFAAGAGPGSGPERKRSLDRDGAIKTVESAVRVSARRLVIISSMGADSPPDDEETFSVYLQAKHDADEAVRATTTGSTLRYTILRPGRLTDDDPTGSVQLAVRTDRAEIPRSDVAAVLAEMIDSGHGNDRTLEVVSGQTSIVEAVRGADTV